jgi:hypothetical protein
MCDGIFSYNAFTINLVRFSLITLSSSAVCALLSVLQVPQVISLSGKNVMFRNNPIISDSAYHLKSHTNDQYCAASSATGFQQQTGLQVR